jgi:hypothetical protein
MSTLDKGVTSFLDPNNIWPDPDATFHNVRIRILNLNVFLQTKGGTSLRTRNSKRPIIFSTIINPIHEKETKFHTLVSTSGYL